MMDPVSLNQSPPPQDVPPVSTTPDADAENKARRGRTTVILREVDPAATEDLILALFKGTELIVVSARMDVQNTWFVQMETEDMAKQAISHLSQQVLCGQPVKARIKSEGLRTTAQPWQPSGQTMAPFPGYGAQGFPAVGSIPAQYGAGWGAKPAGVNRPAQGGFKKNAKSDAEGEGEQGQHAGGRGPRRQGGNNHSGRAGGERKGRKPGSGANAEPKVPVFQPQDFPTLGGQAVPVAEVTGAQQTEAPAPANSWAARAKTAAEIAAAAPAPAPAPAPVPAKKVEAAPVPSQASKAKDVQAPVPASKNTVTEKAESKSPAPVKENASEADSNAKSTSDPAPEVKRRGWEKPEIAAKKESPQTPSVASPPAASQQTAASAPEPTKEKSVKPEGKKGSGQGKKNQDKSDKEANGHVSPIVPLPWATKSFAQIIKETPANPPQASPPSQSATAAGQTVTPLVPTLRSNENWGDVEDDIPSSAPSTGAGKTAGRMEKLDKLKQSSETSDDWRRDAAARRKELEQQGAPRGGDRRRPTSS